MKENFKITGEDVAALEFMYERLILVYNESMNYDYIRRAGEAILKVNSYVGKGELMLQQRKEIR